YLVQLLGSALSPFQVTTEVENPSFPGGNAYVGGGQIRLPSDGLSSLSRMNPSGDSVYRLSSPCRLGHASLQNRGSFRRINSASSSLRVQSFGFETSMREAGWVRQFTFAKKIREGS